MSLKDLPAEMRPREKLLARGPGALSDVELLALLLRTGLPGKGVFKTPLGYRFAGLLGMELGGAPNNQSPLRKRAFPYGWACPANSRLSFSTEKRRDDLYFMAP